MGESVSGIADDLGVDDLRGCDAEAVDESAGRGRIVGLGGCALRPGFRRAEHERQHRLDVDASAFELGRRTRPPPSGAGWHNEQADAGRSGERSRVAHEHVVVRRSRIAPQSRRGIHEQRYAVSPTLLVRGP